MLFAAEIQTENGAYFVGFSGSTGNTSFGQYISKWSLKSRALVELNYFEFDSTVKDGLDVLGSAYIQNGSLILSDTEIGDDIGIVLHKRPFLAHEGFATQISWIWDNRDQSCYPKPSTDG